MDYQNRIGSKKGGGGIASSQDLNVYRKQQISKLFQIDSDPYLMKNHLGQFECKLCLTLHNNKESYLNHINGKKHTMNLRKRSILDKRQQQQQQQQSQQQQQQHRPNTNVQIKKQSFNKIGTPSYKISKLRNSSDQFGLFITINYSERLNNQDNQPLIRFMSGIEANAIDSNNSINHQYLIVSCKPYENIAFKLPQWEIIKDELFWNYFDNDINEFYIQFFFLSL
ncbi:hypothetical protein WICMUC_005052 [Wickerhamomyces mucosus]|uniref:Matrin-type domain-containing protein n=1 Tax=Wickerhamomyces mucosus TaxID=1378264 RepID=A0A9P8T8M2_9ASCO|nr:hypothetical protein WICMUC_005052 [Wickerhamomyces mucosus]